MTEAANGAFSAQQKEFLEGLARGVAAARGAAPRSDTPSGPARPEQVHFAAQDRTVAAGGKLTREEEAKRAKHPFDMWDEIAANAARGEFPKGTDVFPYKFHGLFYVAPAQDSFMLRLRNPNGMLDAAKLRAVAAIAEDFDGGHAHVTTRSNLQVREIAPAHTRAVLERLAEAGLTSRGAGADNIRNITGNPTAGIDPQELYDTRPLGLALHHAILNHRELYGLPRKFNIAFDGGGRMAVLEDTADIGFAAVRVGASTAAPPGIYFRMLLGGLTGHGGVARDSGVLLQPSEVVPAAVAILRLFIAHGDRTDRKRARLHYLVEGWGIEKCLAEAATHLPFSWRFLPLELCEPRGPVEKAAHIGIHRQVQPGLFYAGVVVPAGRLSTPQLHGLAEIAERFGSGTLRLTVWQNLLLSDIAESRLPEALDAIKNLGLATSASAIRGGMVACTGNAGCRFALGDTKRHGLALVDYLDGRLALDQPINIHLTGCPNSCAQHYVGDIGLLATRVEKSEEEEVEGYHLFLGGGSGAEAKLGREIYRAVPAEEMPQRIEAMLRRFLAHRAPGESFHAFANRHSVAELIRLFDAGASAEG